VALYGYAHVPWMSRRQQMIPSDAMPTPQERLRLFERRRGCSCGMVIEIGIDHFAVPTTAWPGARGGTLRGIFRAIPMTRRRFWWGLAPRRSRAFRRAMRRMYRAPSDYTKAVRAGQFSTHRGHVFAGEDLLRGRIIEALMCDFTVSRAALKQDFGATPRSLMRCSARPPWRLTRWSSTPPRPFQSSQRAAP
jgi:oxygen-independent coproporphyrinogen III oxidase